MLIPEDLPGISLIRKIRKQKAWFLSHITYPQPFRSAFMKHILLFFFGLFFVSPVFAQPIIYVTPSGAGNNSGTSWMNALAGIELPNRVVSASAGTQFWVAAGKYKPTITTDRTASFSIASGVSIYGGFEGTETALNQRITGINETILSGDIGIEGIEQDNSQSVVWLNIVGKQTTLDGLTIRDGHRILGDGFQDLIKHSGTGISAVFFKDQSSLRIENCYVANNATEGFGNSGGGLGVIFVDSGQSHVILKKCIFSGNKDSWGGAYYVSNSSDKGNTLSTIDSCSFLGNYATGSGGAIFSVSGDSTFCSMKISNSRFSNNSSEVSGGSIYAIRSNWNIETSTFSFNSVRTNNGTGGVIDAYGASMNVKNSIFDHNSAAYGGIFHSIAMANTEQHFINCTINYNFATIAGGVFSNYSGDIYTWEEPNIWGGFIQNKVYTRNCLIWENMAPDEPVFKHQVFIPFTPSVNDFSATYSIIQGNYAGTGNLNSDPLFVDTANGDYRLSLNSPAINVGDPNTTDLPANDLAGQLRIQGGRVDMGAYEFFSCLVAPCIPILIRKSK